MKRGLIKLSKIYAWYYPMLISVVAILGVFFTIYTYFQVSGSIQNSLLQRVSTIANSLDVNQIEMLAGDESDLNNPAYLDLKHKLEKIRALNPDVRFIYLSGHRDEDPFFFVDSEPTDSPDVSPPGQIYSEASPGFRSVFITQEPAIEGIYTDRWGNWLTALSPIFDDDGQAVAIVGMDVSASEYIFNIIKYSGITALITIFLLIIIGVYGFIRKEQEKRLALRAEILSMASHEIRSPLMGVIWALDNVLKDSLALPKSQLETLQIIRNSCDTIVQTVNDFLAIYSLSDPSKHFVTEVVDVNNLIKEIIAALQLAVRQKGLEIFFKEGLPIRVLGDKDKLRGLFRNLISNAVKYSKSGSRGVDISVEENPKSYVISVSDAGIGIPLADQPKIFDAFFRASNAREVEQGTGLGLFYAKRVVMAHGGRIRFSSKEGVGTIFIVELPKAFIASYL